MINEDMLPTQSTTERYAEKQPFFGGGDEDDKWYIPDSIEAGYKENRANRDYEYHDVQAYKKVFSKRDNYKDNQVAYDAFANMSHINKERYKASIKNGDFVLDDNGTMIQKTENIGLLFDHHEMKGALLSNASKDELDFEFMNSVKSEMKKYQDKEYTTMGTIGNVIGNIGGWLAEDNSILELLTPTKIVGPSVWKNVGKAFGVEFTAASVVETIKQFQPRGIVDLKKRAELDDFYTQAGYEIGVNAVGAAVFRGFGSFVEDKYIQKKIADKVKRKIDAGIISRTDEQLWNIYNLRMGAKLIKDHKHHRQAMEKLHEYVDANKPVRIETDIDINTKIDDGVESVNINDEVAKTHIDAGDDIQEEIITKEVDEAVDIPKDTDPYVEKQLESLDEYADDVEVQDIQRQLDELEPQPTKETVEEVAPKIDTKTESNFIDMDNLINDFNIYGINSNSPKAKKFINRIYDLFSDDKKLIKAWEENDEDTVFNMLSEYQNKETK